MKVERLERSPSAEDGKEAAGACRGQPDSVKGSLLGAGISEGPAQSPSPLCCFPILLAGGRGGSPPERCRDSQAPPAANAAAAAAGGFLSKYGAGIPPAPPPPPARGETPACNPRGRTARFGAWQRGRVGGGRRDTQVQTQILPCPATLPQFPPSAAEVS